MLEIEYQGVRRKYQFYTVRNAVKAFREEFNLKYRRLGGDLYVWRYGLGFIPNLVHTE